MALEVEREVSDGGLRKGKEGEMLTAGIEHAAEGTGGVGGRARDDEGEAVLGDEGYVGG